MAERKARKPQPEIEKSIQNLKEELRESAVERATFNGEEVIIEDGPLADDSTMEDEEPQAENLYSGQCIGGPMDGQLGESRFPKGFVLIDKPNSAAWVYDYNAEAGTFTARQQDIHDNQRGMRAAEESNYDVRAFQPVIDWSVDQ